jgi:hypothetical protein
MISRHHKILRIKFLFIISVILPEYTGNMPLFLGLGRLPDAGQWEAG